MNSDKYTTRLDRLGISKALKKEFEKRLGIVTTPNITAGRTLGLETIRDLISRDSDREKDGFPKKIKFQRTLIGPGRVISVPYVEEEALEHGDFEPDNIINLNSIPSNDMRDISESPGSGEGSVGDVIGEVPLPLDGSGDGDGDDDGDDGDEGGDQGGGDNNKDEDYIGEGAYELGRSLTEKLKLPNLTEKKRRLPTDEYTYELTDRHRGTGQLLDKKETLKRIARTNLMLGRVNKEDMDPTKMIVGPNDRTYRVLAKERVWRSQAIVFFLRDASPSMWGEPTESLLSQHLMIYAWLLAQYDKRVIPRFFVHGTTAKEVSARQYFSNANSGWGTFIPSGYEAINKTVEDEGLASDYDIFIFQGSDGEDGDYKGRKAIPEIQKILSYVSRMGVTLFRHLYYESLDQKTTFEKYIEASGFLERKDVFRMHVMSASGVTEETNLAALKALIAQD